MGAEYTKSQAKATAEYLKKFDSIRIRVPKGKKEQYAAEAKKEGKSLNQFLIDRIEGVPYGYTLKDGKYVVHKVTAKRVQKIFETINNEPIMSEETYLKMQEILDGKNDIKEGQE